MSNVLAKAADSAACAMLNDIGSAGTRLAVWTMWNPKVAAVPLAVGGLSYLANRLLCPQQNFDPSGGNDDRIDGCRKGFPATKYAVQYTYPGKNEWGNGSQPNYSEIVSVGELREFNGYWGHRLTCITYRDETQYVQPPVSRDKEVAATATYRLNVPEGQCLTESDPDAPVDPTPDLPPYEYTDPDTNCNYNVKFEGFAQITPDGEARPVWTISGGETTRAGGGVIGGCNLSPTIYVQGGEGGSGGDGPIPPIPYPPNPPVPDGDGVPWWAKAIAAGATGALLNQIAEGIKDLTQPNYEAGTFTLTAPCDYTEEGDNVTYFFPFPKGSFQQRVIDHQMAILDTLQYHLNSKTPTCTSEKPPLEGEWVTTRWESTEVMPHSGHRLRKQFRYRSKSSLDLAQRSAYWENFQWQSGDVCVIHKGAWWGTPQVWAASEEEGKRVIRFAAGEAGLDPDQTGEWTISRSSSPRYGMSGTMKIQLYKGFPWISSRGGASYPNTLAKVHDP